MDQASVLLPLNHESVLLLIENSNFLQQHREKFKIQEIDGKSLYELFRYTQNDSRLNSLLDKLGFQSSKSREKFRDEIYRLLPNSPTFIRQLPNENTQASKKIKLEAQVMEEKFIYNLQILNEDFVQRCQRIFNLDKKSANDLTPSQDSHNQNFDNFEILEVAKIENLQLQNAYQENSKKKIGSSFDKIPDKPYTYTDFDTKRFFEEIGLSVDENSNEFFLFHSPKQTFLNKIMKENVDEHYSDGGLVGKAIYFAERPMKADEYAYKFKPKYEKIFKDKYLKIDSEKKIQKKIDRKFPGLKEAIQKFEQKDREKEECLKFDREFSEEDRKQHDELWENQKQKKVEMRKKCLLQDDSQEYVMLVFRVNMGNTYLCKVPQKEIKVGINSKAIGPPKGYDSIFVNCQAHLKIGCEENDYSPENCRLRNYREIAIFDKNQVCPVLAIKYRRCGAVSSAKEKEIQCNRIRKKFQEIFQQIFKDETELLIQTGEYFVEPTCHIRDSRDTPIFQAFKQFLQTNKNDGLLLQGEAGSGKSTILFQICKEYYKSSNDHDSKKVDEFNGYIPLWIELRDFLGHVKENRHHDLIDYFLNLHAIHCTKTFLQKEFKFLFVIDSFDESNWDPHKNFYTSHLKQLKGKFIIACRSQYLALHPIAYFGVNPQKILSLNRFDHTQSQKVAKLFFQSQKLDGSKFIKALENPHVKELVQQPLLLWMTLQIYSSPEDTDLTESVSRLSLYETYFKKWSEKEAQEKYNTSNHETTYHYLIQIAWHMYKERVDSLSKHDNMISYLQADNLFLTMRSKDTLSFVHKSFQEYFVAKSIFDSINTISKTKDWTFDSVELIRESPINKGRKQVLKNPATSLIPSEPGIMEFLVDMIAKAPTSQSLETLKQITQMSKYKDKQKKSLSIASANALSIYVAARRYLTPKGNIPNTIANLTLSGCSLKGADLRDMCFIRCHFGEAKLNHAILSNSVFSECNFDSADLKNANFGQSIPELIHNPVADANEPVYYHHNDTFSIDVNHMRSSKNVKLRLFQNFKRWHSIGVYDFSGKKITIAILEWNHHANSWQFQIDDTLYSMKDYLYNPFDSNRRTRLHFKYGWKLMYNDRDVPLRFHDSIEATISSPDDLIWLTATDFLVLSKGTSQHLVFFRLKTYNPDHNNNNNNSPLGTKISQENPTKIKKNQKNLIFVSSLRHMHIYSYQLENCEFKTDHFLDFEEEIDNFEFNENENSFLMIFPGLMKIYDSISYNLLYKIPCLLIPDLVVFNGYEVITFRQQYERDQKFNGDEQPMIQRDIFTWDRQWLPSQRKRAQFDLTKVQRIKNFISGTHGPLFHQSMIWLRLDTRSLIIITSPLCLGVTQVFYQPQSQTFYLKSEDEAIACFRIETQSRKLLKSSNRRALTFQNCKFLGTNRRALTFQNCKGSKLDTPYQSLIQPLEEFSIDRLCQKMKEAKKDIDLLIKAIKYRNPYLVSQIPHENIPTELDLSFQNIGYAGVKCLVEFLQNNRTLKKLNLKHNNLNKDASKLLQPFFNQLSIQY